jgi:hypothetical protein
MACPARAILRICDLCIPALPVTKNVALASYLSRAFNSEAVAEEGPSSNVR